MYKGAFRIWENVLLAVGAALMVAFAMVREWVLPDISMRYLILCLMIMTAALFPRPIWLAANWRRLSRYDPLSAVVSYDLPLPNGRHWRRFVTLKFSGRKKRRFEKTVVDGILFMSHVEGSRYEAFADPRRTDEFVIMPAARTNAAVFAAVGVVIEIALAVWIGKL